MNNFGGHGYKLMSKLLKDGGRLMRHVHGTFHEHSLVNFTSHCMC
jgi:hypothetical protein